MNDVIKDKFPLQVRTCALQMAVSSLRQLNEGFTHEENALKEKETRLRVMKSDLEATREECMKKIKEIDSQMVSIQENISDTRAKLSDLKIENREVAINLVKTEVIFKQEQTLARELETTLKKNFSEWSVADVARLLEELNLGEYAKSFEDNNISGSVLSRLKSKTFMEKLGMSFKQAKLLSKTIFLLQKNFAIHSELKGVLKWTNDDVCQWLSDTKTPHLADKFKAKEVSFIGVSIS